MPRLSSPIDSLRRLRDWTRLPASAREALRRERSREPADDPGISGSVAAAIDWLCRAQDHSSTHDGGVARHYSVISGWGASYPETTGYIVPTLLHRSMSQGDAALLKRSERMLEWLLTIQLPCGAFQGGTVADAPVVPVVFNTGQILLGLSVGVTELGQRYLEAMNRAASWLVTVQDPDGCWRRYESPFARKGDKSYDAHCAWGLLEAARVAENDAFAEAAIRNIEWATSRQHPNGWFADCCLTNPAEPLTHTLGYALRGVIEGYRFTGDRRLLQAARRTGEGLLGALRPDGFLPGRLDSDWKPTVSWSCLTGTCQIAHAWLLLFEDTGQHRFLEAARLANRYVRLTVEIEGPPETCGAVKGSSPTSGGYAQYQYPNWAAKFFVDSNLLEQRVGEPGT